MDRYHKRTRSIQWQKLQAVYLSVVREPQGNIVTSVKNDETGTTWCLSGKSIYSIKDGQVKSLQLPSGFKRAMTINIDDRGRLMATFPGSRYLYFHSPKGWDSLAVSDVQEPLYIHKTVTDSKKRIWLISNTDLFIYDHQTVRRAFPDITLKDGPSYATCLTEAKDGSIWLGTNSGALRITDSTIRYYKKSNGLTDNVINDILTDAEGNIWMGSDGQGLFRFSGAPFIAMDESTKLPSAQIMALAADNNNGLYLGSYDAGLYHYKNNEIKRISFPGNSNPAIGALATRAQ